MEEFQTPMGLSPMRRQLLTLTQLKAGLRGQWFQDEGNKISGGGGQATVPLPTSRQEALRMTGGSRPGPGVSSPEHRFALQASCCLH